MYRGSRVLRSPPVPAVLSVYQRGSLIDGLAMYLSCDTKKFHDNESTQILHNFGTSTHRGGSFPPPTPAGPLGVVASALLVIGRTMTSQVVWSTRMNWCGKRTLSSMRTAGATRCTRHWARRLRLPSAARAFCRSDVSVWLLDVHSRITPWSRSTPCTTTAILSTRLSTGHSRVPRNPVTTSKGNSS